MKPEHYTKIIMHYLNDDINAVEKANFEKEISKNDALLEAFLKIITETKIKYDIDQLVKQSSDTVAAKRSNYKKNRASFLVKIAAIALILFIPSVILIKNYIFTDNTLICKSNMGYLAANSYRGNDVAEHAPALEKEAFSLYKKGKYAKAAIIFSSIADTAVQASKYELYAGISFVWSGNKDELEKAKYYLDQVINSENVYSTAASWFYAIALFETGQKERAKIIFEKFAKNDTSNFKKQEAKKILIDDY